MSEEEKKAIDFFKTQLKNTQTNYTSMYYHVENLELVLNLIEKQQAEIEEYKTLLKRQKELEQEEETLKKQGWL